MKKLFFTVVIVGSLMASNSASAQDNAIKVNIFSPIVRTLNLSYERVLSESSSIQFGFYYTGFSGAGMQYRGFGITPEYRLYLSESDAPAGFYVAPFLRYQNITITVEETDDEGTLSTFGGGLVVGKQWVFKERVTLDLFIGPSYNVGDVETDANEDEFDINASFSGFGVRTGLTLGLAF